MSEQVIDIRDRIEKMRNQMTGADTQSAVKKQANPVSEKKANEIPSRVSIDDKILNKVSNPSNNTKIEKNIFKEDTKYEKLSSDENTESFIQREKNIQNESKPKPENPENFEKNFKQKKNDDSVKPRKIYQDYHHDHIYDENKKSVKFDKEQQFPQFSLNVSNPISWKLMLLIMLMQLLTNIMLVIVLYLK